MTFYLSASGNPQVETITLITVDQNWLPFESLEERELLERLVTDGRYFIKSMRYNLSSSDVMASVIITDTKPEATAFYIIPMGATESYYDELDSLVKEAGIPAHIWDANEDTAMTLPPINNPAVNAATGPQTPADPDTGPDHFDDSDYIPDHNDAPFNLYADEEENL